MKNEQNINKILAELPEEITKENLHLYPQSVQETFHFFEENKNEIFLPKKYFATQKRVLLEYTNELFETSPDLLPKQVLLNILEKLPDFLPANNLVEVTKIITSTWKDLQKKVAA